MHLRGTQDPLVPVKMLRKRDLEMEVGVNRVSESAD